MPIYMKFDSIDGESTAKGHEKWIEVLSFSWGVTNATTRASGGGGGAGKASFQDLHFTQKTQSSSPNLLKACATGEHIKEATLSFIKGEGQQLEFLKIKLEDVLISGLQTGGAEGSDGDRPTDEVSLNFLKIDYLYTPQSADGSVLPPIEFAFDIAANRAG